MDRVICVAKSLKETRHTVRFWVSLEDGTIPIVCVSGQKPKMAKEQQALRQGWETEMAGGGLEQPSPL